MSAPQLRNEQAAHLILKCRMPIDAAAAVPQLPVQHPTMLPHVMQHCVSPTHRTAGPMRMLAGCHQIHQLKPMLQSLRLTRFGDTAAGHRAAEKHKLPLAAAVAAPLLLLVHVQHLCAAHVHDCTSLS